MHSTRPFPAPSLRELSSECETEGVSPDEWERLNILSFVGAMKIARNVAVSERHVEWWNLPTSEFRRGDENRPHPSGFASTRLNGKNTPTQSPKNHPPADETSSGRVIDVMGGRYPGSLSEGAVERSETEGVYFDERKRSKVSETIKNQ